LGLHFAVEQPIRVDLLELVETTEPIARKLREIESGQRPVAFSHVVESAQAFLVATIARAWHGLPVRDHRQDADATTIWVLCPSVHSQELLYESLLTWRP